MNIMTITEFKIELDKIRKWVTADYIGRDIGMPTGSVSRYLQLRGTNTDKMQLIIDSAKKQFELAKSEMLEVQI